MDDVIMLIESKSGTKHLLQRLDELFTWCKMKAIPKKSHSFSIIHGKVTEIHLSISGDQIPTVRELPVKSLGRWYSIPLTDRHRGTEIEETARQRMTAIDANDLPGKLKAWSFQHGPLSRLLWLLQIYEVTISRVETYSTPR